ncbi:hypothetical protein LMG33818_000658 [Halomonadaceae bacterium LMG 33818]
MSSFMVMYQRQCLRIYNVAFGIVNTCVLNECVNDQSYNQKLATSTCSYSYGLVFISESII